MSLLIVFHGSFQPTFSSIFGYATKVIIFSLVFCWNGNVDVKAIIVSVSFISQERTFLPE